MAASAEKGSTARGRACGKAGCQC